MPLPDLESLRCFAAVARTLHFRVAAQQVALSPTAFGERIRRLEDDLGTPLLQRSTRHVALTAAGERLLPVAERLLAEAASLAPLVQQSTEPPFALTVGTRFELGLSWLVPALPALTTAAPHRTLHLRFGDSADLLRVMERGEADAVVTSARLTQSTLDYAPLHEERYVLVGPADIAPLCDIRDLRQHVLLDAHPDLPLFRYLLDALPADHLPQPRDVGYLGTIAAIAMQVRAGHGVAVLPAYYVQSDLDAGRLKRQLPDLVLRADHFRLVWRRSHPHPERLQQLARALAALPLG